MSEATQTVNISVVSIEMLADAIASKSSTVTIAGTPLPVTLETTAIVSIPATLPVSIQGFGSLETGGINTIIIIVILLAGFYWSLRIERQRRKP